MADFPSANPPDVSEHIAYIRFWLGNVDTSIITDEDMTFLIAVNIGKYGEDNCKIVYYSTLDILRWLIREGAKGSSGSAGSGEVSERREKIGKREILEKYAVGTSSGQATGWDKVLEGLLDSPSSIGCNPIDSGTGTGTGGGSVIIGVSKDKFDHATPWRSNLNCKW